MKYVLSKHLNQAEIIKEDIQVIKQNIEDISTKILDTGRRLTRLKNNLPHGDFLPTLEREFDMSRFTANEFMNAYKVFGNVEHVQHLEGMNRRAIKVLTSTMTNKDLDKETKEKILEEVKEQTEETGKALTEKEIKEITAPYLKEIEQLKKEKEQLSFDLENTETRIDNVKSYMESQIETKERELKKAQETIANQNCLIKELHSDISAKELKVISLSQKERELEEKEQLLVEQEHSLNKTMVARFFGGTPH